MNSSNSKVKNNIKNQLKNETANNQKQFKSHLENNYLKLSHSLSVENVEKLAQRTREREERASIVIWKHPLLTIEYFFKEMFHKLLSFVHNIIRHPKLSISVILIIGLSIYYMINQRDSKLMKFLVWSSYWIGLGVLSSVGFGTGLHTFLLYLGPHIAAVTLAAYECGALNFPEPPYPDEIICPNEPDKNNLANIWNIMSKVRFEAMLWGAGTALGELPPYFMARTSRLSDGYDHDDDDDEELREFEEMQKRLHQESTKLSFLDKLKLAVESLVEKAGFFGILVCASVPNPLFDLAGLTCGHFLVPFWTFFGATLIGKAIIKMHLQKLFVIIAFNESLIDTAVSKLDQIPYVGRRLQEPFIEFLKKQKENLHRKPGSNSTADSHQSAPVFAKAFEYLVTIMVAFFLLSIFHAIAQSYHKRLSKQKREMSKIKNSLSSEAVSVSNKSKKKNRKLD